MNVLFVCSLNKWRSPTAERIYQNSPMIKVRSGGTSRRAARSVKSADLKWADLVCVMEPKHRDKLQALFPGELDATKVAVLNVPDEYQCMDDELVELLFQSVGPLLKP